MIKVSILIPIYNVEKYLEQCLESVVNQTLQEIEIICINDGSTDQSLGIIKHFQQRDNRIVIIDKPNTGYGHSMNMGLRLASGEYIGIVESDDFAEPEMFEQLYQMAVENRVPMVRSAYYEYTSDGKTKNKNIYISSEKLNQTIKTEKYKNNILTVSAIWSGLYQKSFLKKYRIQFLETAGASYQDTSFSVKTWVYCRQAYVTDQAFLNYRIDNENSSVKAKGKVYAVCGEMEEIFRILEKKEFENWKQIFYQKKFLTYKSNYLRVADEYKNEFFEYMAVDFGEAWQRQELEEKKWDRWLWKEMELLVLHKQKYNKLLRNDYSDITKNIKQNHFEKLELLDYIKDYDSIILYGAGIRGCRFALYLQQNGITKNLKFAVTKNEKGRDKINQIPVFEIENLIAEKERGLIIVTPTLGRRYEMIQFLNQLGFKNIIALDDNMAKYIKEQL